MMNLVLLLLLLVLDTRAFRSGGGNFRKFHLAPRDLALLQDDGYADQSCGSIVGSNSSPLKVIASFPVDVCCQERLLSLIHTWADEAVVDDNLRTIRCENTAMGTSFFFSVSPRCRLDVQLQPSSMITSVCTLLENEVGNDQLESLIQFSSDNLVESLIGFLSEWLLLPNGSGSPQVGTGQLSRETRELDDEEGEEGLTRVKKKSISTTLPFSPTKENMETFSSSLPHSIIREWKGERVDTSQVDLVLTSLHRWSKGYARKGIGISPREEISGVIISFDAFPSVSYRFQVHCVDGNGDGVGDSDGGNSIVVVGVWVDKEQKEREKLVIKAVEKLICSLQDTLDQILLSPLPSTAGRGGDIGTVEDEDASAKGSSPLDTFTSMGSPSPLPTPSVFEWKDSAPIAQKAEPPSPSSIWPRPSPSTQARRRDPQLLERAADLGLNLQNFEGKGLEEQAMSELNEMIVNSKKKGYLGFLRNNASDILGTGASSSPSSHSHSHLQRLFRSAAKQSEIAKNDLKNTEVEDVNKRLQEILSRKSHDQQEDLSKPPTRLPINLSAVGLEKGIDIFEGPPIYGEGAEAPVSSLEGQKIMDKSSVAFAHINNPTPSELVTDGKRMEMLVTALMKADESMHNLILDSYRDLLLSSSFVTLMKEMNITVSDNATRLVCGKIVEKATEMTQELGFLLKTESMRHLQTIHDICDISANFQQNELEFLKRMDNIRHRFDTSLLSYIKFALAEEEAAIRSKGYNPESMPTTWLQVLRVISQGVFAEFEARYERLLEPLILTVRFNDELVQENVFRRFVNITASLDLPYLRELAMNMITSVEANPNSILDVTTRDSVLRLRHLVDKYLSDAYLQERLSKVRKSARQSGQTMSLAYRNKDLQVVAENLKAEMNGLPDENVENVGRPMIDKGLARNGDIDRSELEKEPLDHLTDS